MVKSSRTTQVLALGLSAFAIAIAVSVWKQGSGGGVALAPQPTELKALDLNSASPVKPGNTPGAFSRLGYLTHKAPPQTGALGAALEQRGNTSESRLRGWLREWVSRLDRGVRTDDAFRDQLVRTLEETEFDSLELAELAKTVRFVEPDGPARELFLAAIGKAAAELDTPKGLSVEQVRVRVDMLAEIRYPLWQKHDSVGIYAETTLEIKHRPRDFSPSMFDAFLWHSDSSRVLGHHAKAADVAISLASEYDAGKYPLVPVSKRRELDHLAGLALAQVKPREALRYLERASEHPEELFAKDAAMQWVIFAPRAGVAAEEIRRFAKATRSRLRLSDTEAETLEKMVNQSILELEKPK